MENCLTMLYWKICHFEDLHGTCQFVIDGGGNVDVSDKVSTDRADLFQFLD